MRRRALIGLSLAAICVGLASARAEDAGLPGVAQASAVLQLADVVGVEAPPVGPTASPARPIEPPLPPETAPASASEPALKPPTTADRLPAAIEALAADSKPLPALGAGDWRAAREAVRQFYSARNFAPSWTDDAGLNAAGRAALARLAKAGEDGLALNGLALPAPDIVERDPDKLAAIETELAAAIVVYGLEASGGRIAPTSFSSLVSARPEVVDPLAALTAVAGAADPDAALAAFNPPQDGYKRLREQLARFSDGKSAPRLVKQGERDAPLIRVASRALSDQPAYALAADPQAQRRAVVLANMEMWRWEPRDMGRDRIEINVPDFTLRLIRNDAEVDHTRVIVGKPDTPTPIFSNAIKYLLVNPIWRVPPSILKKEMLPHLAADPSYLERHGYTVKYLGGQMFVEQPPGEGNALGRILFMFPNEHSVYLHDTPARALFSAAKRDFSHGCIRVEQPLRLAMEVMGGPTNGWSTKKVEGLIGGNERAVFVPSPLPIHIEYFTEFVDDEGVLRDREDIYGLTARVAATLSRLSQD